MSDLNDIVQVTIDRQTQAVARASFGTPSIISEFSTGKTTVAFERHRYYASLTEMTTDGWLTTDPEYKAAQLYFSQNPKVTKVMVGRKDSGDADWATALTTIQAATQDWYQLMAIGYDERKVVFDGDFVASNSIVFTINGTAVTAVPFNTSQTQTMTDIKAQIEADITGSAVTIEVADVDERTLTIKVDGKAPTVSVAITGGAAQANSSITNSTTKAVFSADFVASNSIVFTINDVAVTAVPFNTSQTQTMTDLKVQIEADITDAIVTIDNTDANTRTLLIDIDGKVATTSVAITGGASQPTVVITTNITDAYAEIAAWTETQKKIFMFSSALSDIIAAETTNNIASVMKGFNYDRTAVLYHPSSQGELVPNWFEAAWPGECLPFDPGSQTWAYKTLSGVNSYNLTTTQANNALGKNANIYNEIAGVDVTRFGTVASGEYIDIIRGLDKLESRLQEEIFTNLVNTRKIPFDDDGIQIIAGITQQVLIEMANDGLLVETSIVVTKPKASAVSSTDKANRNLPDIKFTATLQGAIHTVVIEGVVTV
jgi:hypothetical protein